MTTEPSPRLAWSKYAYKPRDDMLATAGDKRGYVAQAFDVARHPEGHSVVDIEKAANVLRSQGQLATANNLLWELATIQSKGVKS